MIISGMELYFIQIYKMTSKNLKLVMIY